MLPFHQHLGLNEIHNRLRHFVLRSPQRAAEVLAMQLLLKATHPEDNDRRWRHDDDGREVNKRHIS